MKRGTPRHPKMIRLARTLQIQPYAAVGIMEALWHFSGEYTPAGDIGRFADGEIAAAVAWEKEPADLVAALVECHWLDTSRKHRLIIHDWPDHADEAVKKRLQRMSGKFLPEYGRNRDPVATASRQRLSGNGFKGNHVPPRAGQGKARQGKEGQGLSERFPEFLEHWPEHRVGVDLGCQVWISLVDSGELTDFDEVIAGLERWKQSELWTKQEGKFISAITKPDGSGWLQKRAWRDHPKPAGEGAKWL